ncbi:MAG: nuclear transport factor 2 family protein [Actinobacteria bacterium]|nr:nuclear transport factor 2 family protein [Actinomycetota bacterium]
MTTFDELAHDYINAWNETDATTREAAVGALFAHDARYVDPMTIAEGHESIAATIDAVHNQFPGFIFRLAGPVDGHHEQLRFGWELGPVNEPATIIGFDVATLDTTGKVNAVYGFLDKVTPNA